MDHLFDMLYDILFQPQIAMRRIAEQKNVGQALVVVVFSLLIPIWALYFGLKATTMISMFSVMVGVSILGGLMTWVIGGAIWHLIAELLGGKGTALGLLAGLGFASVPRIFIVPLWMFVAMLPASSRTLLLTIAVLSILAWLCYLDILAIKEVHQLTMAKSVIVISMPLLVIALLCIILAVWIGSSILMYAPM